MGLLLHQHFADFDSRPDVAKLLLHEDKQAVVFILNAVVSASPVMMEEIRRLQALLKALGVKIEARWLPSGVNSFANALSHTWVSAGARATDTLVSSICRQYAMSHVVFHDRPFGETLVSRTRYLATRMKKIDGMGAAGCGTLTLTLFLWYCERSRPIAPMESSSPFTDLSTPGSVAYGLSRPN